MNYYETTKSKTYLFVYLFIASCDEKYDFDEQSLTEVTKINDNVSFKEGIISISSKDSFESLYNEIKRNGKEKFYFEKLKKLENEGFHSLRPYFEESDEENIQLFLSRKLKRRTNTSFKNTIEELELDDDIIIDNNFAILLNEEREIIVGQKLYRYVENGVYEVPIDKVDEFHNHINSKLGFSKKSEEEGDFYEFHDVDYDTDIVEDDSYIGGGSSGYSKPTPEPNFFEAKQNFSTSEFSRNPSLWGQTFGYARKEHVYLPDSKRIQLKYWNRNYVLFKSLGTEIRFQKKVKILGIVGWQKSYPDKIALGVNSAQFNYDLKSSQYLNPSIFNKTIYKFNGKSYFPNGIPAGYQLPAMDFPLASLLGDIDALTVYIVNPFSEFDFKISLTSEQYADAINTASTQLIKLAAKEIPSWFGIKPSTTSSILSAEFYKDILSMTISNLNWMDDRENNITKYFDFTVPTITLRADIASPGQSFFSNPTVPFPNLSFDNYKTGVIDFYGGVLYKNKWYGKRMVSKSLDR